MTIFFQSRFQSAFSEYGSLNYINDNVNVRGRILHQLNSVSDYQAKRRDSGARQNIPKLSQPR